MCHWDLLRHVWRNTREFAKDKPFAGGVREQSPLSPLPLFLFPIKILLLCCCQGLRQLHPAVSGYLLWACAVRKADGIERTDQLLSWIVLKKGVKSCLPSVGEGMVDEGDSQLLFLW